MSKNTKYNTRRKLWELDRCCVYCNIETWLPERGTDIMKSRYKSTKDSVATIEHITPLSIGGSNTDENMAISCWDCNTSKCNTPHDDFMRIRKMSNWKNRVRTQIRHQNWKEQGIYKRRRFQCVIIGIFNKIKPFGFLIVDMSVNWKVRLSNGQGVKTIRMRGIF